MRSRWLLLLLFVIPITSGCTDTQVCSWLHDHGQDHAVVAGKEYTCFHAPETYDGDGNVISEY